MAVVIWSTRSHYRLSTAVIALLAVGLSSCAAPDYAPVQAAGPAPMQGPPPPPAANWLSPTGPFKVVMEEDAGLPEHTIYRPEAAASGSPVRFPVVAFAGPGCDSNGTA